MKEDTTSIIIQINQEKKNIFKAIAAMNKETMTDVIIKAIDRYLDRHKRLLK
jgi:uncharacterized protein YdbL (DUF1318 family)